MEFVIMINVARATMTLRIASLRLGSPPLRKPAH